MATKKKTKAGKASAKPSGASKKAPSKAAPSASKTVTKGTKKKPGAAKPAASKSAGPKSAPATKPEASKASGKKASTASKARSGKSAVVEVEEVVIVGRGAGATSKATTSKSAATKPVTTKPVTSRPKAVPSKVGSADDPNAGGDDADADEDLDIGDDEGRKPSRLRSQPVEVQEIDQRIDRERKSRLVPFTPRSYGSTPKKPKPLEIIDVLGKHMGKAPSLPPKQMPATVVELGIYCIFALGGNSAKASLDATNRLTKRFPGWNEFRVSEAYEFLEELEGLGLREPYDNCEQVLDFVNEVYKDQNEVSLEFLRDMSPDDRLVALNRYRSLGPSLSQYLALGLQDFEGVIFHYSWARPIQRVGIVDRSGSPKKLCASIEKMFKGLDTVTLQVDLIDLGEEICLPKAPNCKNCYLVLHCKSRKV